MMLHYKRSYTKIASISRRRRVTFGGCGSVMLVFVLVLDLALAV